MRWRELSHRSPDPKGAWMATVLSRTCHLLAVDAAKAAKEVDTP